MRILTVSTKGVPKNLHQTATLRGFEVITLGIGRKWTGFALKSQLFKEELSKPKYENTDVFVLCDAYDVVVVGTAGDLFEKYKKIQAQGYHMVSGCESTCLSRFICFENASSTHDYAKNHPCRYVNGGFMMGDKQTLLDFINIVINTGEDEQFVLGKYTRDNPKTVYMDVHSDFVTNYTQYDDFEIDKQIGNDQIFRTAHSKDKFSIFVHAPGVGFSLKHTTKYNKLLSQLIPDFEPIPHCPFFRLYRSAFVEFGSLYIPIIVLYFLLLAGSYVCNKKVFQIFFTFTCILAIVLLMILFHFSR
jgi:hypothetical protein